MQNVYGTYGDVSEFWKVGGDVIENAVNGPRKRGATDQQDEHYEVRECCRKIHHLKRQETRQYGNVKLR